MEAGIASAHFIADRVDAAAAWAEGALKGNVDYGPALRIAIASHALAGRADDAGRILLRHKKADPDLHLANLRTRVPYGRASDLKRLEDGLRLAGLSD